MKEKLMLFLKGMLLGCGFIIPGVSGGALAVLMGFYEELVEAAGNFYKSIKDFKKYFMFLLPIGLGAVFSVVVFARIIEFGLAKAPIITVLIFLGLIIGGIPGLFKNVGVSKNVKDYLLALIGIILVVGLILFHDKASLFNFDNISIVGYIGLFIVGVIGSLTIVVPGISGSFTLMILGVYEPILKMVNEITSFKNLGSNIMMLGVFALGLGLGVILISKLIEYCLKHHKIKTYYVIFGFVIASVISVIYELTLYPFNLVHLIIGLVLLVINTILSYKVFDK